MNQKRLKAGTIVKVVEWRRWRCCELSGTRLKPGRTASVAVLKGSGLARTVIMSTE
jgi:hypothetical protein